MKPNKENALHQMHKHCKGQKAGIAFPLCLLHIFILMCDQNQQAEQENYNSIMELLEVIKPAGVHFYYCPTMPQ